MWKSFLFFWCGWCLRLTTVEVEKLFQTASYFPSTVTNAAVVSAHLVCLSSSDMRTVTLTVFFIPDDSPVRSSQPFCFSGVTDYLSAEISTSKQKRFSLLTFVDTPGLVDGDMIYPFNVNSAITWLGMSLQLRVCAKVGSPEHFSFCLFPFFFLCRRAGRSDICLLWPYGSGPLQTHPQHCWEAEWEMWRQTDVLPQQGRWSRQWNRQTSSPLQNRLLSILEGGATWISIYVCLCRGWWCR